MGFIEAVKTCFRKCFKFSGRAPRSEYWWWILFAWILGLIAFMLDALLFGASFGQAEGFAPLNSVVSLLLLIPGLSVSFRRLHDVNRSGWWIIAPYCIWFVSFLFTFVISVFLQTIGSTLIFLVFLISIVYMIAIFIWFCTKGTIGPNKYGPDPLEGMHEAPAEK